MAKSKLNDPFLGLRESLERFEDSWEGVEVELRFSLADLVLAKLREKGWTQVRLAREARVTEQQVTRVVRHSANWQVDTAAKLLFALGVKHVELVEKNNVRVDNAQVPTVQTSHLLLITEKRSGTLNIAGRQARTFEADNKVESSGEGQEPRWLDPAVLGYPATDAESDASRRRLGRLGLLDSAT
jgi:hypothetical protein